MARTQVVCLLPARNAAADLPGFLASAARFCDAVVALDDGSTDETRDVLAASSLVKVLLTNPVREDYRGWDDAGNRNRLLAAAGELDPAWIVSVDADERIDAGDAAALRRFLATDALPGCAYGFRCIPIRRDLEHYLANEALWVYRLFAYAPGQRFSDQRLHLVPVPTSIPAAAWVKTTLRIQHLGGLTAARRSARYEKYRQADPEIAFSPSYVDIVREAPGELRRWEPRPPDLPVLLAAADLDEARAGMAAAAPDEAGTLSTVVLAGEDGAWAARTVGRVVAEARPAASEVVVVAPRDGAAARTVRERFPAVALIEVAPGGSPGAARNAGLRAVRGDAVDFVGSGVNMLPGGLAARARAHRTGYPMVTGVAVNEAAGSVGLASFVLERTGDPTDHRRPGVVDGPTGPCSFVRVLVDEVGGFPEDRRTDAETEIAVYQALVRRGYVAYRDPAIRFGHRDLWSTPGRLLRYQFDRGRDRGRLIVEHFRVRGRLANRGLLIDRLLGQVPRRLRRTMGRAMRGDAADRRAFRRAFPLVVGGLVASWLGTCLEVVRPEPAKLAILFGRPTGTMLVVGVADGRAESILLVRFDLPARRVDAVSLPCDLEVAHGNGGRGRLDDALGMGPGGGAANVQWGRFLLHDVIGRAFDLDVDDYAIVDRRVLSRLGGAARSGTGRPHRVAPTADAPFQGQKVAPLAPAADDAWGNVVSSVLAAFWAMRGVVRSSLRPVDLALLVFHVRGLGQREVDVAALPVDREAAAEFVRRRLTVTDAAVDARGGKLFWV